MKETDFAFAVAYLRTIEGRFFSNSLIKNLENSENLNDFFEKLKTLNLKIYQESSLENLSAILDNILIETCNYFLEICPKNTPFSWLFLENDFSNYYAILTANFLEIDWENLILKPCLVNPKELDRCVKTKDFDSLPIFLKSPLEYIFEKAEENFNSQEIGLIMEKKLYETLLSNFKNNKFLKEKTKLKIDLKNLVEAAKNLSAKKDSKYLDNELICGGKIEKDLIVKAFEDGEKKLKILFGVLGDVSNLDLLNLLELEKFCDAVSDYFNENFRNKPFGFEPIIIFLEDLKKNNSKIKKIAAKVCYNF